MTDLPNPFSDSGASPSGGPDEAASLDRSQGPSEAADLPEDLKQRLLAAIEDDYRFSLNEEKFLFDIGCVPEDFAKYMAMMEGLTDNDEPPLFIQQQRRA